MFSQNLLQCACALTVLCAAKTGHAESPAAPARSPTHASPRTAGSAPSSLALVLGGVGIAGVAVGAMSALWVLELKGVSEDHCSQTLRMCDSVGAQANREGRTLGPVSVVGWAIGLAGIGGAIVFWRSPGTGDRRVAFQAAATQAGPLVAFTGRW